MNVFTKTKTLIRLALCMVTIIATSACDRYSKESLNIHKHVINGDIEKVMLALE
ncbi:MAG: hypothetical protein GY797_04160 [Deltaproteobacteria bacterium]|nr:hypothetical protein [Deltaproteobacteria bacterium]